MLCQKCLCKVHKPCPRPLTFTQQSIGPGHRFAMTHRQEDDNDEGKRDFEGDADASDESGDDAHHAAHPDGVDSHHAATLAGDTSHDGLEAPEPLNENGTVIGINEK